MCRQGLPRQFATSVKTTGDTFPSRAASPSPAAAAARDALNAAITAPGWGVPAPPDSDTCQPQGAPGVPAELEQDLQHPNASVTQPLALPQGRKPARFSPRGRTNPGCSGVITHWTMHQTPGQVTHWERKLGHTQTSASGLSHAGAQPYSSIPDPGG